MFTAAASVGVHVARSPGKARLMDDVNAWLVDLALKIPALLLAVTVHELAHGIVADRLGDPTARSSGRLTLNPIPHIDPLGAIAFIVAGFGWAKPVPVNAGYFRHPRRDMAYVAVAGPISNFLVAFLSLTAVVFLRRTPAAGIVIAWLAAMLAISFQFNVALGIFNLIPLPPLDGGHLLPYVLPRSAQSLVVAAHRYGPLVLIVLVVTGGTQYILGPVFRVVSAAYITLFRLLF